jgi:hypothetical protein
MKIGNGVKIENIRMGVSSSGELEIYGRGTVDGSSRIFKADKDFNIIWTSDLIINERMSYFAIYNDYLYSLSDIGNDVYKTNINDGASVHLSNGDLYWGSSASGIAIDVNDGNMLIASGSKPYVYKFNPNTLTQVWRSPSFGTIDAKDMSYDGNDSIYVAHKNLEKLRAIDGTTVWEIPTVTGTASYTAVKYHNNHVYSVGASRLSKHDVDGNLIWSSTDSTNHSSGNIYGLSINSSGDIVTASIDGTVIKYDDQGNIIWQSSVLADRLYKAELTDDGYVYTSSLFKLHKLDPNGNEIKTFDTYYSYGFHIK